MRDQPIIFSGSMVKAIRAGRKTQTRRLVSPRVPPNVTSLEIIPWDDPRSVLTDARLIPIAREIYEDDEGLGWRRFRARRGSRLWVKETFCAHPDHADALTMPEYEGGKNPAHLLYRADVRGNQIDGFDADLLKWRPSIFMPRWASRLTLEVLGVRAERLQDIDEEDAVAEGVERREHFIKLWETLHGHRAPWGSDPWVWVVEFRKLAV